MMVPMRTFASCLLAGALLLTGCSSSTKESVAADGSDRKAGELTGVVAKPAPDVSAVTLPTAADPPTSYSFVPAAGHLNIVYFGYTACPDVCPTTLSDIRAAFRKLPKDDVGRLQVVMATIDPRRDTAEVITGYLKSFFADGVALRTDDDAVLRAAATAFGATYEAKYPNQGEPQVEHSAYTYVIDDTGHVVDQWPFGMTSADMTHDLELLLAAKTSPQQ